MLRVFEETGDALVAVGTTKVKPWPSLVVKPEGFVGKAFGLVATTYFYRERRAVVGLSAFVGERVVLCPPTFFARLLAFVLYGDQPD
ncbi:MAG: hypothetical protein KC503_19400 [Myxococcales bacterium]|nr:hypothetical protein [Myxococcales bacterium]